MNDAAPTDSPTASLSDDLGVIEGDQFCTCGYNLHGQRVQRDERLGFAVVRCAECGAFHPAGHGSTATRAWLRRLAGILLVVWIGIIFLWCTAVGGTWFGLAVGLSETYGVYVELEPATGRVIKESTRQVRFPTGATDWKSHLPADIPTSQHTNIQSQLAMNERSGGTTFFDQPIPMPNNDPNWPLAVPELPELDDQTGGVDGGVDDDVDDTGGNSSSEAEDAGDTAGTAVAEAQPTFITLSVPVWIDAETDVPVDMDAFNYRSWNHRGLVSYQEADRLGVLNPWDTRPPVLFSYLLIGIAVLLGIISGLLQAISVPHQKTVGRLALAMLPVAVFFVLTSLVVTGGGISVSTLDYYLPNFAWVLVPAVLAWWITVWLGRPVARAIVSALLPPKPRQAMAYLWHADGKTLPV